MISILVLQTEHGIIAPSANKKKEPTPILPHMRVTSVDYFSLTKAPNSTSPLSPAWPRLPSSPIAPQLAPSVSSSNSSRGSWSSLFNTGSMRQFMNGVQDTFKDGLTTPSEVMTPSLDIQHTLTLPKVIDKSTRSSGQDSPGSGTGTRRARIRKDSSLNSPATTTTSRSWNENTSYPSKQVSLSFSSTGRKASLRFTDTNSIIHEKRVVTFKPPTDNPWVMLFLSSHTHPD